MVSAGVVREAESNILFMWFLIIEETDVPCSAAMMRSLR